MHLPISSVLLALPVLAAAAEGPFDQYKAQFQNLMDSFGSYIPTPSRYDAAQAHSDKTGDKKLTVLTIENWKEKLYEPVKPGATEPEEWWVLISGRNKTCYGHCDNIDAAFNETAVKLAGKPNTPHMGYVNCDDQPILCTSWSCAPGALWVFEMLPRDTDINIWFRRLNYTTVTTQELLDLQAANTKTKDDFRLNETMFHPFNSWIAKNGLATFSGYFFWVFNKIPNWAMMLIVSFFSRRMMTNRMNSMGNGPVPAGAAPGQRAARPGDARS